MIQLLTDYNYICVILMFAFSLWSLIVGLKWPNENFPLGKAGKLLLIFNAVVMSCFSAIVLVWRIFEVIGKV